jgi:DNA-binding response OmpR family regulator
MAPWSARHDAVTLTARDPEMDTIPGLTVESDDYVTRPFSPRELVTLNAAAAR